MPYPTDRERDRPWVIRTYAGHSSAAKSNALYRRNLAKGQTGLSVAFDLPTQTGYDPDDELARGEVGKVGVPVSHLGDMRTLFDGIPLAEANTSMTINAPAMWLLALYVAVAEEQGADRAQLAGHDAERHRQGVPLARHLRVPAGAEHAADHRHDRLVVHRHPEVEPDQHLQLPPAGGRRDPRAGAGVLAVDRDRACSTRCATPARSPRPTFGTVVGRISFFVNAGLRFVEEMCKMRAFVAALGRDHAASATAITDAKAAQAALRRAGQLARPDRGAAGEQRPADRAGDARR